MSRAEHEEKPFIFAPRRSDDPFWRIQQQAEARARNNGADEAAQHKAGRKAMILRRAILDLKLEPDAEHILRTVCGEHKRCGS